MIAPIPAQIGRFVIEGMLGRGGMGTVVRARDGKTGQLVALKFASHGEVDDRQFEDEVAALSRLGHPGVVRVLGHGLHEAAPGLPGSAAAIRWCALELVEGEPLRAVMVRARDARTSGSLLPIFAGLCETLSHVHAAGLVHRDLNPDNVIVREDGRPVLIDFGLASWAPGASHRERLEAAAATGGRLGYMAPEQLRGDLCDGRADLYALGCLLFEATTGRLPFLGSAREVIKGHLECPAPPVPQGACDPDLARLIAALLSKAPTDRPRFASDVGHRLAARALAIRSAFTSPTSSSAYGSIATGDSTLPSALQPPHRYLPRPEWVGRTQELETVEGWLARPGLRLGAVVGESGIGKTRLLLEIAHRARARGIGIVVGGARATGGTGARGGDGAALAPLQPLLNAIAAACREGGVVETERLAAAGLAWLAPLSPAIARALGIEARMPAVPPEAFRLRLFDALSAVLARLGERGPMLIVIDDVQWADDLTLGWLATLAAPARPELPSPTTMTLPSRAIGERVFVLLGARAEEMPPALERAINAGVPSVRLAGLAPNDMASLVTAALPAVLDEGDTSDATVSAIVATVTERAAGNPFFASEYLCLVSSEGLLHPARRARWGQEMQRLGVPASIERLMHLRLSRLPAHARALAELGAVLGREHPRAWLPSSFGDDHRADTAMEDLVRLGIVGAAGEVVRFTHDRLREELLAELAPARLEALNRQAADIVEGALAAAAGEIERQQLYPALARHWIAARHFDKGVDYLERAATAARAVYANADVIAYLLEATALAESAGLAPGRRATLMRHLGEAETALGKVDVGRGHLRQALELLGHPFPEGTRLKARVAVEFVRQGLRRWLPRELSDPATKQAATAATCAEAARCCEGVGYLLSDQAGALYAGIAALNLAERADATAELERSYASMAVVMGIVGWPTAAEAYFDLSRATGRRAHNPASEVWRHTVEGYYRISRGELCAARDVAQRGVELAARVGDERRREDCLSLLAEIAIFHADPAAAYAHADELARSAQRRGDRQTGLWAATNHARMSLMCGEASHARTRLTGIEPDAQRSTPTDFIMLEGLRALADLGCGDRASALRRAQETVARAAASDPAFFFGLHGLWPAIDVLVAAIEGGDEGTAYYRDLDVAVRAFARLARHHPIARPRYFVALGQQHRLRYLRHGRDRDIAAARRSFGQAVHAAERLGMPHERAIAWALWDP